MFFLFFIAGRWLFHLSHFQGSLAPGFSLKWTPSAGAEQADWGWLTPWESVCLWLSGGSIWTLFPHHWDLGFQPHFSFPAAFYKWMVNPGSPGGSWFCIGNQSKVLFDFFLKKIPYCCQNKQNIFKNHYLTRPRGVKWPRVAAGDYTSSLWTPELNEVHGKTKPFTEMVFKSHYGQFE